MKLFEVLVLPLRKLINSTPTYSTPQKDAETKVARHWEISKESLIQDLKREEHKKNGKCHFDKIIIIWHWGFGLCTSYIYFAKKRRAATIVTLGRRHKECVW